MKAVIQRVSSAHVTVQGHITGKIGKGILVFLGIEKDDGLESIKYLVDKVIHLRIFEDQNGKMNLSLANINGEMLVVSQFTILADHSKGRRPSFTDACEPQKAKELYNCFVEKAREKMLKVETGIFQATMDVTLTNDGPVTMILHSKK